MRILYLAGGFPYPLLAGHLRYFHFMRQLAKRHEVSLFSLAARDYRPEHGQAMAAEIDEVRTFRRWDRDAPLGRFVKEDLRFLWRIEPGLKELREAVAAEVATGRFDVVVLAGKRVFPSAEDCGLPIVADVCDAESERFRLRMPHARGLERAKVWMGWRTLRAMETRVVAAADRVLFASPRDRDVLMAPDDPRAVILPNGVDTAFWKRSTPTCGRHTLVFTGAMHYRPNADAAMLLIREIFPAVRREAPDARLFVVGRDPSADLVAAGRADGVHVTGMVDDVRPYLESASLFAAPLRYASGIQNKVLEAMAMALPVVTSPAAASGLFTADGEKPPLTVVGTVDEFANAILRHFAAEDDRRAPMPEARRFVEKHFSWVTHAAALEQVLEDVTAGRRERVAAG